MMDGNILDPDGAREHLAAWKGRIDKLAADTQTMSQQLEQVRVTASDSGGLAQVTVDSSGALVDLRLSDRIYRAAPEAVASTIMATIADARRRMADRSQEIITGTLGTESAAARAIAERVGRQLGGGSGQDRVRHSDEDYDFDQQSYLDGR